MNLTVKTIYGTQAANSHVLICEESKTAAVFDVGYVSDELLKAIEGYNLEYIFLTHRHYDHILGAYELHEKTGAKIVIGEGDAQALSDPAASLASHAPHMKFTPTSAGILVENGDEIVFCSHIINVIATPGHTIGGVCYAVGEHLFTGDTLFNFSIGRTDLPTGDMAAMRKTLSMLKSLEKNYTIYAGHGDNSTLDFEKKRNPYLSEA